MNENLVFDQEIIKKFLKVEKKLLQGYDLSSQGFESDEIIRDEEIKEYLNGIQSLKEREMTPDAWERLFNRLEKYYLNLRFKREGEGFVFRP